MAIRKVKIMLVPSDPARQIAALVETDEGWEWPAAWATLQTAAHEAMEQILEESTEIRALCETLADAEGVEAGLDLDDDIDEEIFVCGAFEIDLREMLEGDDHVEAATALVRLLEAMQESTSYYADVLVGGKRLELDEAVRSIAAELQAQGIDVGSDEVPRVSFEPGWATVNPPPPTPPPEKKGKAAKLKANTSTQGGFGGLDEDEATRNQPRVGAPHSHSFTHEEHYFIYQTRIEWPVTGERLEQLRKSVLKDNHPDKFASHSDEEKGHAHQRFVWLNTGADRLADRLKRGGT